MSNGALARGGQDVAAATGVAGHDLRVADEEAGLDAWVARRGRDAVAAPSVVAHGRWSTAHAIDERIAVERVAAVAVQNSLNPATAGSRGVATAPAGARVAAAPRVPSSSEVPTSFTPV